MIATALDTLRMAKRLKEAGFNDAQAEAVTGIVSEARDADLAQLATKADVAQLATKADVASLGAEVTQLQTTVKSDLAVLRSQLEAAIVATKADIIRWVFGIAIGLGAMIIAALRLFPAAHP
jgi:hypothetical protein